MQLCISRASKLEGSDCFQLWISFPEVTGHSKATSKTKVDMSTVPEDYHDFTDIFSKSKAGKLADHRPYDLKITLDEGLPHLSAPSTPCPRRNLRLCISSLMRTLLQVHPSLSLLHGAPVLFIQKKDGSL